MAIRIRRDLVGGARDEERQILPVNFAAAWLIANEIMHEFAVDPSDYTPRGEVLLRQIFSDELEKDEVKRLYGDLTAFMAGFNADLVKWYKQEHGEACEPCKVPALEDLQEWDGIIFCKLRYHLEQKDGQTMMVFDEATDLDEPLALDDDNNIVPLRELVEELEEE